MRVSFCVPAVIAGALAACGGQMNTPTGRADPPTASPARDPEIAVREEFEAAERQNRAAAYRLFAARHPDHPLAVEARRRAEALEAADDDDRTGGGGA